MMAPSAVEGTAVAPSTPGSSPPGRRGPFFRRYATVLLNLAARLLPTWRSRRRRRYAIEQGCREMNANGRKFKKRFSFAFICG